MGRSELSCFEVTIHWLLQSNSWVEVERMGLQSLLFCAFDMWLLHTMFWLQTEGAAISHWERDTWMFSTRCKYSPGVSRYRWRHARINRANFVKHACYITWFDLWDFIWMEISKGRLSFSILLSLPWLTNIEHIVFCFLDTYMHTWLGVQGNHREWIMPSHSQYNVAAVMFFVNLLFIRS